MGELTFSGVRVGGWKKILWKEGSTGEIFPDRGNEQIFSWWEEPHPILHGTEKHKKLLQADKNPW